MPKQDVLPYESLVEFANAEITQGNWKDVLNRLGSRPSPSRQDGQRAFQEWVDTYRRLGFMAPRELKNKRIAGPQPLQKVQGELRQDLDRLTDPERDIDPPGKDKGKWMKEVSENFDKAYRDALQQGIANPLGFSLEQANRTPPLPGLKNLTWLVEKINSLTRKGASRRATHADGKTPVWMQKIGEMEIPMMLSIHRANQSDSRVLLTDRISFVPVINDLRIWVYYRLAHLWADGFLPRIGRCQNPKCPKFFLGKTSRKEQLYCSQRCAQQVTAPGRVKASRVRRAIWADAEDGLQRAMENMQTLRKTTQKQALERGEKALQKAEAAFTAAYPRKKGPGYEEGALLLAGVKRQTKRLRKREKGY